MRRSIGVLVFILTLSFTWLGGALADEATLSKKLDLVLQNQQAILKALGEVKNELQVVKVRASNT